MLPLCAYHFVCVSAAPVIPLSLSYPPGIGERSLYKAGASLPVYMKNSSFTAPGSTVRQ